MTRDDCLTKILTAFGVPPAILGHGVLNGYHVYWGFPIRSSSWKIRMHCYRSPSFAGQQWGKEFIEDLGRGISGAFK